MKISEIVEPKNIDDKLTMVDYLISDKVANAGYELHHEIKKNSSIGTDSYVKTPRSVYGEDLDYIKSAVQSMIDRLIINDSKIESQIIQLLNESLNYLNNRH
jgi:hypothetical protein